MDTSAPQWPQDIVMKPMEEIVTCPKPSSLERSSSKVRPQKEHALNCPRCNSTNTKFCYYNNYSLSQPRYFCKTCRRYWTEGGSLRNIPVGGGSRKNKRPSSNNLSKKLPDLVPQQNPNSKMLETTPQDLNLGFSSDRQDFKAITEMIQVPNFDSNTKLELQNPSSSSPSSNLELLTRLSSNSTRGLNAFMPLIPSTTDLNMVYSSGFSFNPLATADQFKPSLNFSLDGLGSNYGNFQQETTGKLLFPFEDLKQVSSSNNTNDHGEENWNGVIGNGGPW